MGSLLIEIPANFQAIKATDMELALRWRLESRERFEDAFARGYVVVDLVKHGDALAYVLETADGEQ